MRDDTPTIGALQAPIDLSSTATQLLAELGDGLFHLLVELGKLLPSNFGIDTLEILFELSTLLPKLLFVLSDSAPLLLALSPTYL